MHQHLCKFLDNKWDYKGKQPVYKQQQDNSYTGIRRFRGDAWDDEHITQVKAYQLRKTRQSLQREHVMCKADFPMILPLKKHISIYI